MKMNSEERAEAVLKLIESDFGQSGRDVRFMAIRDELQEATRLAYEDAIRICEEQANEPECQERATYCAEAIQDKLKELIP